MSFYKTNQPTIMSAWNAEHAALKALRDEVNAFAARFGATGRTYSDPGRFAGLQFTPAKPRELWRAPDKNGLQCPRSAPLKGATAETKAALKELQAEWDAHVPTTTVDSKALFDALQVSWGDFLFSGLTMFAHEGWLYAKTGAAMPVMTEILGSEFEAARVRGAA